MTVHRPQECPRCGGWLVLSDGDDFGYLHEDGCPILAEGVPVSVHLGDGEEFQLGWFIPTGGESRSAALAKFLHGIAVLMFEQLGIPPDRCCRHISFRSAHARLGEPGPHV